MGTALSAFFITIIGLWGWWLYDINRSKRGSGAHGGADWEMTMQEYEDY